MMASRTVVQALKSQGRSSTSSPWIDQTFNLLTTEEMVSSNHYPLDTNVDDGGSWILKRVSDSGSTAYLQTDYFRGSFTLAEPYWYLRPDGPAKASDSTMHAKGTTAIARCAPTNPSFSLSTALGELASDGLPSAIGASAWKSQTQVARGAGSEYLNTQFGWLPLIRDIQGFARSVKDSDRILNAYRKGSDRKIREGYYYPVEGSTSSFSVDYGYNTYPNINQLLASPYIPGSTTAQTSEKYWFRGAFRYHIPVADDVVGKFQRWSSLSDHLLGWKVTPETVWNIAPWSWATDWFANTGDIMTNISNLGKDGLVMQYGYQMRHASQEVRHAGTVDLGGGRKAAIGRTFLTEWKQRVPATPYGFGVELSTLSGKQLSIIAALGLSRT